MGRSIAPEQQRTGAVVAPQKPRRSSNRLRIRSIAAGIIAALILIGLIALGSRGFHWFDGP